MLWDLSCTGTKLVVQIDCSHTLLPRVIGPMQLARFVKKRLDKGVSHVRALVCRFKLLTLYVVPWDQWLPCHLPFIVQGEPEGSLEASVPINSRKIEVKESSPMHLSLDMENGGGGRQQRVDEKGDSFP